MKVTHILALLCAIALIIFSVAYPVPEKHLRTSSYSYNHSWSSSFGDEYVGGDAYNYQMEASLKAGYMAGVMALKTLCFIGGLLLLFVTLFACEKSVAARKQADLLQHIAHTLDESRKIARQDLEIQQYIADAFYSPEQPDQSEPLA